MTLSLCFIQLSQLSDSERPILLTQPVRLAHFEEIIYIETNKLASNDSGANTVT